MLDHVLLLELLVEFQNRSNVDLDALAVEVEHVQCPPYSQELRDKAVEQAGPPLENSNRDLEQRKEKHHQNEEDLLQVVAAEPGNAVFEAPAAHHHEIVFENVVRPVQSLHHILQDCLLVSWGVILVFDEGHFGLGPLI